MENLFIQIAHPKLIITSPLKGHSDTKTGKHSMAFVSKSRYRTNDIE